MYKGSTSWTSVRGLDNIEALLFIFHEAKWMKIVASWI